MADKERARPAGNGTALSGMKEICAYVGKSENTIKKYIREESFPATKIGGTWESDIHLIDIWRKERVDTNFQIV